MSSSNRLIGMRIPQEDLINILNGNLKIKNIPDGAKSVMIQFDFMSRSIDLILEHDSFEPVPSGVCVPQLFPAFQVIKSA